MRVQALWLKPHMVRPPWEPLELGLQRWAVPVAAGKSEKKKDSAKPKALIFQACHEQKPKYTNLQLKTVLHFIGLMLALCGMNLLRSTRLLWGSSLR